MPATNVCNLVTTGSSLAGWIMILISFMAVRQLCQSSYGHSSRIRLAAFGSQNSRSSFVRSRQLGHCETIRHANVAGHAHLGNIESSCFSFCTHAKSDREIDQFEHDVPKYSDRNNICTN